MQERKFYIGAGIIVFLFALARLFYFDAVPFTAPDPDSRSYLILSNQIEHGIIPHFDRRTMLYPTIIFFLSKIYYSNFLVILVQNIVSLLACLFLYKSIYKLIPERAIFTGLVIGCWTAMPNVVYYDQAILTESFFTSGLMAFLCILADSLIDNNRRKVLLASLLIGLLILLRPAGIFLLGLTPFLAGYWFFKKRLTHLIAFLLPVMIIAGAYSVFNKWNSGFLGFSAFGELNIIGTTKFGIEPSPEFDTKTNIAILAHLSDIPPNNYKAVEDPKTGTDRLYKVFRHNYPSRPLMRLLVEAQGDTPIEYTEYLMVRPIMRKLYQNSLRQYPQYYVKFVRVNLTKYFFDKGGMYSYQRAPLISRFKKGFFSYLNYQEPSNINYFRSYPNAFGKYIKCKDCKNEFEDYVENSRFAKGTKPCYKSFVYGGFNMKFECGVSEYWSGLFFRIFDFLFGNIFVLNLIPIIPIFILPFMGYKLLKQRFVNNTDFVIALCLLCYFGHGLLICLVEFWLARYSYPTEFFNIIAIYLFFASASYKLWKPEEEKLTE